MVLAPLGQLQPSPKLAVHAPGATLQAAQITERATAQKRALPGRVAEFGNAKPVSPDTRRLADWIASTADNGGVDFIVIDKKLARLYVFDASAQLVAHTPVLLGWARGDESVPGIGERPIPQVRPHERTTPAGRFVAERGTNSSGEDVVWVDYDAAVSMHRVRRSAASENRPARLASRSAADNRISYGCINVPVAFFDSQIEPRFAQRKALVYVLPDHKSLQQVFPEIGGALPGMGTTPDPVPGALRDGARDNPHRVHRPPIPSKMT